MLVLLSLLPKCRVLFLYLIFKRVFEKICWIVLRGIWGHLMLLPPTTSVNKRTVYLWNFDFIFGVTLSFKADLKLHIWVQFFSFEMMSEKKSITGIMGIKGLKRFEKEMNLFFEKVCILVFLYKKNEMHYQRSSQRAFWKTHISVGPQKGSN